MSLLVQKELSPETFLKWTEIHIHQDKSLRQCPHGSCIIFIFICPIYFVQGLILFRLHYLEPTSLSTIQKTATSPGAEAGRVFCNSPEESVWRSCWSPNRQELRPRVLEVNPSVVCAHLCVRTCVYWCSCAGACTWMEVRGQPQLSFINYYLQCFEARVSHWPARWVTRLDGHQAQGFSGLCLPRSPHGIWGRNSIFRFTWQALYLLSHPSIPNPTSFLNISWLLTRFKIVKSLQ